MAAYSIGSRVTDVTADNTSYITAANWTATVGTTNIVPTSATIASDLFTLANHGLNNGDILNPTSLGTVTGTGLSINAPLFVVGSTTNTFQVSLTFGGSAIDLGGANTTPSTFTLESRYALKRTEGCINVTTSGTYRVLPSDHFDTDSTTVGVMGARDIYIVAGVPFPLSVKKVFSTGSASTTGITCIFNN
jgi:hypothetical protein